MPPLSPSPPPKKQHDAWLYFLGKCKIWTSQSLFSFGNYNLAKLLLKETHSLPSFSFTLLYVGDLNFWWICLICSSIFNPCIPPPPPPPPPPPSLPPAMDTGGSGNSGNPLLVGPAARNFLRACSDSDWSMLPPGGTVVVKEEDGRVLVLVVVVVPSKTSERWERRRLRFAATSDVDRFVRDWRWSDLARCSFQRGSRSSTLKERGLVKDFFWVGLIA